MYRMQETTDLFKAFISSSLAASCFSFSSSWRVAMPSFSVVRSNSVSSCLALVISSSTSSSALLARICREEIKDIIATTFFFAIKTVDYPGSLALLLADIDAVAGVVLLHLHGLHLLLDRLHGGAGVGEEREELQGVGARLRSS